MQTLIVGTKAKGYKLSYHCTVEHYLFSMNIFRHATDHAPESPLDPEDVPVIQIHNYGLFVCLFVC